MKRPCMALSLLVASLTGSGIATGPVRGQGTGEQVERMHADVCPLVADDCFGLGYGYGTCGEPLVGFRDFPDSSDSSESPDTAGTAPTDDRWVDACRTGDDETWFGCETTGACGPQDEVADFPFDPIGNDAYWNEWDNAAAQDVARQDGSAGDVSSENSRNLDSEMDCFRTGYDASYDRAVYGAEVRADASAGSHAAKTCQTVDADEQAYWAAYADAANEQVYWSAYADAANEEAYWAAYADAANEQAYWAAYADASSAAQTQPREEAFQRSQDDYWAEYARTLEQYRAEEEAAKTAQAERDAYWEAYEAEMQRIREETQVRSEAADVAQDAPAPIADEADSSAANDHGDRYDDYGYEEYYDEYYEDYYSEYYDDDFERAGSSETTEARTANEPEVAAEVQVEAAVPAEAAAETEDPPLAQPTYDDFGYGDAYYDEYGYDYYDDYQYRYEDDGRESAEAGDEPVEESAVEESGVEQVESDVRQVEAAKEAISTVVDEMARSPLLEAANASVRQVSDQIRDLREETSVVRSWQRMLDQLRAAQTQPSLELELVEAGSSDPCDDAAYWSCDQWGCEHVTETQPPVAESVESVQISVEWRLQLQRRAVLAVARSLKQTSCLLETASEQLQQVANEQAAEISRRQADSRNR